MMRRYRRKSREYVKWMADKFKNICYYHGGLCGEETIVHHEPPRSQGGDDADIFLICPDSHTEDNYCRHKRSAKEFWSDVMDIENPTDEQYKTWLLEQKQISWKLFLTAQDYHGPMPKTRQEFWDILDTIGCASTYGVVKRSSATGPIVKKQKSKKKSNYRPIEK